VHDRTRPAAIDDAAVTKTILERQPPCTDLPRSTFRAGALTVGWRGYQDVRSRSPPADVAAAALGADEPLAVVRQLAWTTLPLIQRAASEAGSNVSFSLNFVADATGRQFEWHGSLRRGKHTESLLRVCAVTRPRFSVGANPTRDSLQPEAIGLKLSISVSRIGDSASVQAATRVNVEQASKRTICRPTRRPFRGRLTRRGEMSEEYAQPLHRGSGGSMYTRKAHATQEAPMRDQG
jgi:hypothetical protein